MTLAPCTEMTSSVRAGVEKIKDKPPVVFIDQ
jgi:hypothetical protein